MPFIEHNNRRLLYLHVPKTGGTTIESWLGTIAPLRFHSVGLPTALRCTPQHLQMKDFNQIFGNGYFDHVVMTVRNPYDRIASEYRMQAMLEGKGVWKAARGFSLWLEQVLDARKDNPYFLDNHLRPQWEFLGSGVEVLKFEDGLPSIVARIATILGVEPPATLGHDYHTSASGITVKWDKIDRLRVQEVYRKDFESFGYSFKKSFGYSFKK